MPTANIATSQRSLRRSSTRIVWRRRASATPAIKDGADAKANTTITLSDDALAEFAKTGAAQTLYQHGDVRIDGSIKPVHRLGFFKQLV